MEQVTKTAIETLSKFEYSSEGFPKRYPDQGEFFLALEAIKAALGYEEPITLVVEDMVRFEIHSKSRTRFGQTYEGQASGVFAEIGKIDGKATIRMVGHYGNKDVDIRFIEGETAIYDSYNFDYLGEITKITDKAVTINPSYGARTKRLNLNEFMWRNYDFDIEKSAERRRNWSD